MEMTNVYTKCISLWQPWATLLVRGFKKNETRSWPLNHRGRTLIHAAKRWTREQARLCASWPFNEYLDIRETLPLGCLVGVVDFARVDPVHECGVAFHSHEWHFGDYSPGRWVWQTSDRIEFTFPIPHRGAQGVVNVDIELPIDNAVPYCACPKCKKLIPDYDGFGVLAHRECGYCTHACRTGGVCEVCGDVKPTVTEGAAISHE